MQFRFDGNQEYQLRAIDSVIDLFQGQPKRLPDSLGNLYSAIPNRLEINENDLILNLNQVQFNNGLEADSEIKTIETEIDTIEGRKKIEFPNFSIEMETGTGKTYVYTRTILELNQRYGMCKFIIVVPSVAIREGVFKSLQITYQHFRGIYSNLPYRYKIYDSANLNQIRQFAFSDNVEIMIMTIDSFNKNSNIINQSTDHLQGETPIHLLQATRPVLILDEPQNMESELRIQALSMLNPLFTLRYSATHRNPYNLIYKLSPYEAYRQGLVKHIEVAGVEREADENQIYLRLDEVLSDKKSVKARIAIHKLMLDNTVDEQVVTVYPGDTLESKANRTEYSGFVLEEIDVNSGQVFFANGVTLKLGESRGADKENIFDAQIRYTISEHFRKQEKLRSKGIKVLSLFFIDRVDNYALEDGVIRRLFNNAFSDLRKSFPEWNCLNPEDIQSGYFASRRSKEGKVILEDSKTGESERDRAAYDLIMKDKERLLSFTEPTSFIFSHSALREGWDNPNIFQICTLNQTKSEVKKRQEIGRGVRLAVDQQGDRVFDETVNVLTVVANESYEGYVNKYQQEVEAEFGSKILPPRPANARERGIAHLHKEFLLKPEFKELWELIKQRTRYVVQIDSEELIQDVVDELNHIKIRVPEIVIRKAKMETDEDQFIALKVAERAKPMAYNEQKIPNLVSNMSELLERTSPPVRLTRRTLLEIFKQTSKETQTSAIRNPFEFSSIAAQIIKSKIVSQLISGIKYEKINQWFEMTQFIDIPGWSDNLIPVEKSIYDHVAYDSDIEKKFAEGLEKRDDVKLFVKLPSWFIVSTPIGEYNPDWAIVIEPRDEFGKPTGKEMLYLVRETKGSSDKSQYRIAENAKIYCGKKHFELLNVSYDVVVSAKDL